MGKYAISDNITRKTCATCGRSKPLSAFYATRPGGKTPRRNCIPCHQSHSHRNQNQSVARRSGQWRRDNPERAVAITRRYTAAHRVEINARRRAADAGGVRYQQKQERLGRDVLLAQVRANALKRRYGITPEEYDMLLAAQGGKCAICGRTAEENKRRLAIDHDHTCCPDRSRTCGRCIRGLLCTPCNNRLGVIENAEWVSAATVYLLASPCNSRGG